MLLLFFFSSRRRHTRYIGDWSSDVCSSDLTRPDQAKYLSAQLQPNEMTLGKHHTKANAIQGTRTCVGMSQKYGLGPNPMAVGRRNANGSSTNNEKSRDPLRTLALSTCIACPRSIAIVVSGSSGSLATFHYRTKGDKTPTPACAPAETVPCATTCTPER